MRACVGEGESSIGAESVAVSYHVRLANVGLARISRAARAVSGTPSRRNSDEKG